MFLPIKASKWFGTVILTLSLWMSGCSPSAINAGSSSMGNRSIQGNLLAQGGDSQVALVWGSAPRALHYNVLRSASSAGPFLPIAMAITTLTYTDRAVINGQTYFYQVEPVYPKFVGVASSVDSATPLAPPSGLNYVDSPLVLTRDSAMSPAVVSNSGGPITQCLISPALPAGLTLSSLCTLSGTPTVARSTGTYTVVAKNNSGTSSTTLSLRVLDLNPVITYAGSPFSATVSTSMPTISPTLSGGAITNCTISPTLPTGLSLSAVNCAISGTPSVLSSATTYTVTATSDGGSATAPLSLAINAVAPTSLSFAASPITLVKGSAMTAVDSTHSGGALTACSGTLPAGLSVSVTSGVCRISGTPTAVSSAADYTITATNSGGSTTATVNIRVNDVAPSAFGFAASPLALTQNVAMTAATSTSTGTLTGCSAATLPAGLSVAFVSGQCRISGTPTTLSPATDYTITASNSGGTLDTTVSIAVNDVIPSALAFAAAPFVLTKGSAMTAANSTESGGAITSCSGVGLPAGLSVSLVSGHCRLSGTPSGISAASDYTINATNSGGTASTTVNITVNDVAPTTLAFAATPLSLTQNTAMTAVASTSAGGAITSCTGTLPAGLTLGVASNQCQVSGTPTTASAAADYTITATNSGGSTTATLNIEVISAAPSTPTGLAATGATRSTTLTWTQVTDATGYKVYRSTTSTVTIADTLACTVSSGTTVTCTESSLSDGTTYYYAILATKSGADSALSAAVSALTRPAAPINVTVTPGNLRNTISWDAVTSATSYTIKRGANGGPYNTTVTCNTSTATSCTEISLTAGTTYYYVVIANNATGASAASAQASGIPFGNATKLAYTSSPGGKTYSAGTAFSPSITVAVRDASNNLVSTSTASVTIALVTNTAGGTLSGTLTRAAVNGVATFDDLSLNKPASNYTMRATSSGLTNTGASTAFTVTVGSPSQLTMSAVSGEVTTCIGPVTLTSVDSVGNASVNTTGTAWTINLSKSAGSAVFYGAADSTCSGSAITSVSIANAASSTTFYVKDAVIENFTLTADGTGAVLGDSNSGLGTVTTAAAITPLFTPGPSRFAYVVSNREVNMYSLDDLSGEVSALSPASVTLAYTPYRFVVDPKNRFAYGVHTNDGYISMFTIHPLTGILSPTSPAVLATCANPREITFDPGGNHAYVTCDTDLQQLIVNQTTGVLTPNTPATVTGQNLLGLGMHPSGKFLYSFVRNYPYGIQPLIRNTTTGTLSLGTKLALTSFYDGAFAMDPTGQFLYYLDTSNSRIVTFLINATSGDLTQGSSISVSPTGDSYQITLSRDGKFVYTTSQYSDLIQVFTANVTTGVLSASQTINLPASTGPVKVAVDFDTRYAYSSNWYNRSVDRWDIDATTGALSNRSSTSTTSSAIWVALTSAGPVGPSTQLQITGTAAAGICSGPFYVKAMDANGLGASKNTSGSAWTVQLQKSAGSAQFYAGSDAFCTGSAVTSVDIPVGGNSTSFWLKDAVEETFTLTADGSTAGIGSGTLITTATSSGRLLYLISAANLQAMKIDPVTGALTAGSTFNAGKFSFTFAPHPSGRYFYISDSSLVTAYRISTTNGSLRAISGVGQAGPASVSALTTDPTGKFLYAIDQTNHLVYSYTIDPLTGEVTATSPASMTVNYYPGKIAFDPQSRFAYVAAMSSSSGGSVFDRIAMFSIHPTTGILTPTTPANLAVAPLAIGQLMTHPNGKFLYLADKTNGKIGQYSIDQTTGVLTALTPATVNSGWSADALALAPSGNYLYSMSLSQNTLYYFSINSTTGLLTPVSSLVVGTSIDHMTVVPNGRILFFIDNVNQKVTRVSISAANGVPAILGDSALGTYSYVDVVSP